jgi:hypothetical protein
MLGQHPDLQATVHWQHRPRNFTTSSTPSWRVCSDAQKAKKAAGDGTSTGTESLSDSRKTAQCALTQANDEIDAWHETAQAWTWACTFKARTACTETFHGTVCSIGCNRIFSFGGALRYNVFLS